MEANEAIEMHYWVAAPRDKLGQRIRDAFNRYQREIESRGWRERIVSSWQRYHGADPDGGPATSSDVIPGGEAGEIDLVQVNHYRSIVESMLSLATSSRPAFRAAATDDSADSMAACHLAEQVWEHELERGMEPVARSGGERMLVEGECGVLATWDAMAGDVVGGEPVFETDEDGQPILDELGQPMRGPDRPIHAGDLVYEALGPLDIARDLQVRAHRDLKWVIVRRVLSRWDLVAIYQDDESVRHIIGADGPPHGYSTDRDGAGGSDGDDQCYVLELYHERTPAVPGGRYARVVGTHVLEEGELPYTRMPIVVKSPAAVLGKALGYTKAWDMMGLAKLLDAAASNMASTADRHGQRPLLLPEGSDIDAGDMLGPTVVDVKTDPTTGRMVEPKWMEVPEIPSSAIAWAEWLQGQMQVLSGVNSVVRGDPEASLKSGAALALVQAMAVQHNSAFQASYAELLRDLATLVIDLYKENARAERTIDIVGDDEIGAVRTFTSESLTAVRRVRAELANPLMRTIAGKKELADFYADSARWPNDPPLTMRQHIGFITTGRLEPLLRAGRSEEIGIRAECEALTRGEPVRALVTDSHEAHLREHKAILDGKQRMRLPVEVIAAVDAHVKEHEQLWVMLTMTRPALLAATGQRPAPMPPPPPGMAPPGPGGPPPANGNAGPPPMGAPANDSDQPPLGPPSANPIDAPLIPGSGPPAASMPQAPINPATGERAVLPDGAMQ